MFISISIVCNGFALDTSNLLSEWYLAFFTKLRMVIALESMTFSASIQFINNCSRLSLNIFVALILCCFCILVLHLYKWKL